MTHSSSALAIKPTRPVRLMLAVVEADSEATTLAQGMAEGKPRERAARAIAWLRQHFVPTLSVVELAATAGMSASALCAYFKVALGMTPLQFQRRLRMREARRLILVERLDLESVCARVGYPRLQELVRDYQRAYRRSPWAELEWMRNLLVWTEEKSSADTLRDLLTANPEISVNSAVDRADQAAWDTFKSTGRSI